LNVRAIRKSIVLATVLTCSWCLSAFAQLRPTEWIDATTGHRIVRLSTEPGTKSLYFNQNGITPDGKFVIANSPSGIVAIEIATRRNRVIVPGHATALFVGRKSGSIYFTRTATEQGDRHPTTVFAISPTGTNERRIVTLDNGEIQSINADETLLAGVVAERAFALESGSRDPRFDANYAAVDKNGKPFSFAEAKDVRLNARVEARIPMEMFTIDTRTGERKVIHRSTDWLNHLQFSPVDPNLLLFCHEGPWHRVDRIWSMRLPTGQPQLMHHRTMNMEIAGHEFFAPDGKSVWYDLQTPRGEVFWLAQAQFNGERKWFVVERNDWSVHYNISPDGQLFLGDGGDSEMVAHAPDGKWLYLFHPEPIPDVAGISAPDAAALIHPGKLRAEKLVDLRKHDYRLEPNAMFTLDGKWIIFRSNMHGDAHTYMVEVAKAATDE
jgi:oligogalacturonide lyase